MAFLYSSHLTYYKKVNVKMYFVNNTIGSDGSKFNNQIIFHKFRDSLNNEYILMNEEEFGKPTIKDGDSVLVEYEYYHNNLFYHDTLNYCRGYKKIN